MPFPITVLTGEQVAGLPVGRPVYSEVLRRQRALRDPRPQLGQALLPLHEDVVQLLPTLLRVWNTGVTFGFVESKMATLIKLTF